jgi:hypothetical protein
MTPTVVASADALAATWLLDQSKLLRRPKPAPGGVWNTLRSAGSLNQLAATRVDALISDALQQRNAKR